MSGIEELDSYTYDLPEELIAQDPPARRGDSRMLLVEPGLGPVGETGFRSLIQHLDSGDVLVVNDSRVLAARLLTRRVDSGGTVELLLVRPVSDDQTWLAMARPARRLRPGVVLECPGTDAARLEIITAPFEGFVEVRSTSNLAEVATRYGQVPLPPYIRRGGEDSTGPRAERDRQRYQTVYAQTDPESARSVAAPTAGLHFSEGNLDRLQEAGIHLARVRLDVGPGTFRAPTKKQIDSGVLHREWIRYPAETDRILADARERGSRIVAVGTTSLRVLEAVARLELDSNQVDRRGAAAVAFERDPVFTGEAIRRKQGWEVTGNTRLFIRPPDTVRSVQGLLTNFHLPGSSLLMLVAALVGDPAWRNAYREAVARRFRFYSYGDCMLVLPGSAGRIEGDGGS